MNADNRLCPGDGNKEIKRRCLAIVSLFSKILNKLITSAPKEVVRLRWESRDRSSAVFREHKTSGRIQLSHTCAEDAKLMPICNWKCSCHYLQQPASSRERSKEPSLPERPLTRIFEGISPGQRGAEERSEDATNIQAKTNSFISMSPEAGSREVSATTTSSRMLVKAGAYVSAASKWHSLNSSGASLWIDI